MKNKYYGTKLNPSTKINFKKNDAWCKIHILFKTNSRAKTFGEYVALVWTRLFLNVVGDILRNILSSTLLTKSTKNFSRSGRSLEFAGQFLTQTMERKHEKQITTMGMKSIRL
jgi:hypothetical protein